MVTRFAPAWWVLGVVVSFAGPAVGEAHAQTTSAGSARGGVVTVSPELAKKLASDDPAELSAALDEARIAGRSASHLASNVAAVLDRGATRALTIAALETLREMEDESVAPQVAPYASHRDVKVRRLAVQTLARCKGPVAVRALRQRLGDADAMVRGYAASGLGALKAKDATADLFAALDHKVTEAAAAIGQVCAPKDCEDLAARLGRQPFDVMTGGFEQILFRPSSEVPDDTKGKIIRAVAALATGESSKFLRDVKQRLPKSASPKLKLMLDQAIASGPAT